MIPNISGLILRIPEKAPRGLFGEAASWCRSAHREGEAPSFPLPWRLLPPSSSESSFGEANAFARGKAAWLAVGLEPPPGPTLPGLIPDASVRPGKVGLLRQLAGHAPWTGFWFSGADRSAFL